MQAARGDPPARQLWLASASISALAVCAAAGLQLLGRSARAPCVESGARACGPRVVLVATNAQAVTTWRERALRGRTVVHLGRFLHFVSDEARRVVPALSGPGRGAVLDEELVRVAGPRNHLWIATSLGIARRIFYLPPPGALEARLASLGLDRRSLPARLAASEAIPRTLLGTLPATDEPVVLDVNASWLDEGTAAQLLEAIDASRVHAELVTLSLAEDADDVSDAARAALREVARSLARRAGEEPR